MASSIQDYLAELLDPDQPVVPSGLLSLSDLPPEDLALLREQWPDIDSSRLRGITALMVELAEDNAELDFCEVFRMCLSDPDAEVRERALGGLANCDDRSLIDPLIGILSEDKDPAVRAAAASALGKYALMAELGKLPPDEAARVEGALLSAMASLSEHLDVYCSALEAVGALSKPHVEELIREAYRSESNEFRASSLRAMGRNCNPSWLPILLKELRSRDPLFRLEAARACGELEAEEAVPRVAELLDDRETQVQLAAIHALGAIGGQPARRQLEHCLESEEDFIREAAQEALDELGFWDDPLDL